MAVPGAFFEVTGRSDELFKICAGIDRNDGRLTAESSATLDVWQEMYEEWFRIYAADLADLAVEELARRFRSIPSGGDYRLFYTQAEIEKVLRDVLGTNKGRPITEINGLGIEDWFKIAQAKEEANAVLVQALKDAQERNN
jgi:hypothetical protein